jgi:uncharacterized protein (AIM24 family)
MQSRIIGTTMPVLEFVLEPSESIISEAGELSWMSSSIQLLTHTQLGGGGGIFGVLRRVAGGGTLFMTEYRATGASGEIAFATKVPGHILPIEIGPGHEHMVHRHGFFAPHPRSRSALVSSNPLVQGSSAAMDSCFKRSAGRARHGWNYQAR